MRRIQPSSEAARLRECPSYGAYELGFAKPSEAALATAVAASAAFPPLLPALDLRMRLKLNDRSESWERVLLSDGGIIDNLGISVFEKGRKKTPFVFDVDYILSSSAGHGKPRGRTLPYWFVPRILQSSVIQFRKLQDAGLKVLHWWKASGSVKGFALAYLGQDDSNVPSPPPDLIPKIQVDTYPTDFKAMSADNIRDLSKRGEQLMEAMIREYCPDLLRFGHAGDAPLHVSRMPHEPWADSRAVSSCGSVPISRRRGQLSSCKALVGR